MRPFPLAMLTLLCGARSAAAHDVAHPRVEGLDISPAGLRLRVDYEIAAGPRALMLRAAFDRNRDGVLDPGEQAALGEHLARQATLRTQLFIDGAPAQLSRVAARAEKIDLPASSSALLAVRVELQAAWPKGWGRRLVELRDEDPSGHVPVTVACEDCVVSDASSGVPEARDTRVRGANTPLALKIRLR